MAEFDNFQGFAEECDNLSGSVSDTLHAVMKATGLGLTEALEHFKPLRKLADSVQATAHQLWWEQDGEFYCTECGTTCDEAYPDWRGKQPEEAPSICRACQKAINKDHEITDRMNCRGTPYQY
jgi:hypothetical protein